MKRCASLIACSLFVAAGAAYGAVGARQWVCQDPDGNEVRQAQPCTEINTNFRRDDVPGYVWGIVALLGVAWVFVLMPERLLRLGRQGPRAHAGREVPQDEPAAALSGPTQAAPSAEPIPARPPRPASVARPASWSLEAIARLPPGRFDELVQALWQANGYTAVATGTDVKIHSPASGNLFAVAQRFPSPAEAVPAAAVEGLWDHVQRHGIGLGICYGVAGFATDALMFAQGKRLKLVSGAELLAQLRALKPEHQQALLERVSR